MSWEAIKTAKKVFIVGSGYPGGQPKKNVELGPSRIRQAGLHDAIKELGWSIEDKGDIDFQDILEKTEHLSDDVPKAKNGSRVCQCTQRLFHTLHAGVASGAFGLTLGGDHSLAIGSISAIAKTYPDIGVIWVDAHADINTPDISPSGNVHGMPVAFLLGLIDSKDVGGLFSWVEKITPDRLVYIALRDVDAGEKVLLKKLGILAFSMREVDEFGIAQVLEKALDHLKGRPIHLSYDVDANDPSVSPSTGTKVKGGLTRREARYLCESLATSGRLVSMDVVEVNPGLGSPEDVEATATNAVDLVASALGLTLL